MRKINFVINPNPYPIGLDGRIIKKYSILYLGDSNVKYVESIYQKLFSTGKLIHAANYWEAFDSILCYLPHDLKVRAISQNFYPIQNINEETLKKLLSEVWKREEITKKEEPTKEEKLTDKEEPAVKEEPTKKEESKYTIKIEDIENNIKQKINMSDNKREEEEQKNDQEEQQNENTITENDKNVDKIKKKKKR